MADKLDVLIALAAKDCGSDDVAMWNSLDTSDVEFRPQFVRRMNRLLSKHKHAAERLVLKKILVRVAVALMALLSLAFLTVMAIEPLREAIFQAVVEWYDDHLTIRYERPQGDVPAGTTNAGFVIEDDESESESTIEDEESSTEEETVSAAGEEESSVEAPAESQAAVEVQTDVAEVTTKLEMDVVTPPTTIEDVRMPTYIPEGVVEDVLMANKLGVYVDYYLGDEWVYSYMQDVWKETDIGLDNVGASVEYTTINEYEAIFVESTDTPEKSLVWNDGRYVYRLSFIEGDLDEMVKIAESVTS